MMTLEKTVLELKTEMEHSKDTIWRLQQRVFVLEREMKNLKAALKEPRRKSPSSTTGFSKAKRGEIARRKRKLGKARGEETEQIASSSSSTCTKNLSSQCIPNSASPIKVERLDDYSDSDNDSSMASLPNHTRPHNKFSFLSQTVATGDDKQVTTGPEKERRQRKRKSGRKADEIWSLFAVTHLSDLHKQAKCRKCAHVTNWAKVENLRVHVARCQKQFLSSSPTNVPPPTLNNDNSVVATNNNNNISPTNMETTTSVETTTSIRYS